MFERAIVSASIVALLALLSPSAAWAHRCGPQTLKVKKGNTVSYAITGRDYIDYQISDKGDPLVAKIEPQQEKNRWRAKVSGCFLNGAASFLQR
jgi:hypothetical protein